METKIEITKRQYRPGRRNYDLESPHGRTRVYFSHEGENIIQHFGNRHARPVKLYKEQLKAVAKAMGLPEDTKFRWSTKAGCTMCPCSPGFICDADLGRDVHVTLSGDAPHIDDSKAGIAAYYSDALVGQLEREGMISRSGGGNGKAVKGLENYVARQMKSGVTYKVSRKGTEAVMDGLFYIRPATSSGGYRIVLPEYGTTKIFSVTDVQADLIVQVSDKV